VIEATSKVVVLAFDLVDETLPESPVLLARALQSPQVQDSVTKILLTFAKSKLKPGTTAATYEEGQKLLESLQSGVVDAAGEAVLKQIEKSPQYRRLKSAVDGFEKAIQSSPLGVWVEKNKLYIVGVALLGPAALYYTKSSNTLVKKGVDFLKDKQFDVLQIGTLSFKASLWDFQPDARILGGRVLTTKKWKEVSVDLKLGLLAKGADVQEVAGETVVKSGPFSVNVTAGVKPQVQQVNLGLKLDYSGVMDNGTFKIGVGAMYQDQKASATLDAALKSGRTAVGVQGNLGQKDGGGVQYGALLTLSVDL
jgi:hypothetical protein